jgi:tRNA (guanine6-N2)-methyltransferase
MTIPGLESIAATELEETGAEVKKTEPGLVVFRPEVVDRELLNLRTVEDVFILVWGSDSLTYRAEDLDRITRWTAREPDWPRMLALHHAVRPKPSGKPTYHLVSQMLGEHGYRRVDALKAMAKGLSGKFPASWRPAEENAAVEVWLIIHGKMAVCGLRLSDKTMRHRTYKLEHRPASLRPVVAAAMIRLANPKKGEWLLDPMCGAGTILAERLAGDRFAKVLGGDLDGSALYAAGGNLRRLGEAHLVRWDARQLPLADASIHCVACNPPFGKQLGEPEEIGALYQGLVAELHRVLKPGGRAVLLVSDEKSLDRAIRPWGWRSNDRFRLRILGQTAFLTQWTKPA